MAKKKKKSQYILMSRLKGNRCWNTLLMGMQIGAILSRKIWQYLMKLNTCSPLNPATLLLGIYPEARPPILWKYMCKRFFTEALLLNCKILGTIWASRVLIGKDSTSQCRRRGLIPDLRRSHIPRSNQALHHSYWACAPAPRSHNYWAHMLKLLKPTP